MGPKGCPATYVTNYLTSRKSKDLIYSEVEAYMGLYRAQGGDDRNCLSIQGGIGKKKTTSPPTRGGKIITLSLFVRNLLSRRGKRQRTRSFGKKSSPSNTQGEIRQKGSETTKRTKRVDFSFGKKFRMKLNCALLTTTMEIGPKSV
jgi:hypothetical protein